MPTNRAARSGVKTKATLATCPRPLKSWSFPARYIERNVIPAKDPTESRKIKKGKPLRSVRILRPQKNTQFIHNTNKYEAYKEHQEIQNGIQNIS
jgi:hypothetical protein